MARINIEDDIFKDNRFIDLCIQCGSKELALGRLFAMWMVAQKYYLSHGEIPNEVWIKQNLSELLVTCGLAERTSTGVRARGQNEQFAWLRKAQDAGKLSAKKRRNAPSQKPRTLVGKKSNQGSTVVQGPSTSLLFTPFSSLSSHSSLLVPAGAKSPPAAPEKLLCKQIWSIYESEYVRRYQTSPVRNATVNAQIQSLARRLGNEAPEVVKFYIQHNKSFYLEKCHPIGLCLSDAEALRTQWARGRAITRTEANSADKSQANINAWDYASQKLEEHRNGK